MGTVNLAIFTFKSLLVGGAISPSWKMMEFVNGKDHIPYMKWNIKFMFETTNQFSLIQIRSI